MGADVDNLYVGLGWVRVAHPESLARVPELANLLCWHVLTCYVQDCDGVQHKGTEGAGEQPSFTEAPRNTRFMCQYCMGQLQHTKNFETWQRVGRCKPDKRCRNGDAYAGSSTWQ